eukprot:CAMPEP_0167803518 /NCGR_PEP_ID=MMETSP0111_2-20121227/19882_1 /TAXON_ID=91324 /ORGANISM="Lotharella globosa, Strain CCCM811" /LENGTH=78 /DNA_ID=CAMNT_0007699999 /DNA_START=116 /DNA_END=348 /DNA_ORIENTATION=-
MTFVLAKAYVDRVVAPKGILVPTLHHRPLTWNSNLVRRRCSNCNQRIRTNKAWTSPGFNACVDCFRDHTKKQKREEAR